VPLRFSDPTATTLQVSLEVELSSKKVDLLKAGILDLSISIPVLLIVILLSMFGFSIWFRYNRSIEILSEEGEAVDNFQFLVERLGYVDPCSGNIYPILVPSLTVSSSPVSLITQRIYGEYDYLYLFPVLVLLDNGLRVAIIGVEDQDACLFIYY